MKKNDSNIEILIKNAANIIAPLWPMQTIIARNPLQGIESISFEEAMAVGEKFLAGSFDEFGNKSHNINREVVKWCQVFLDEGQATITMPEREKGFYRSWALLVPYDSALSPSKNRWLLSLPDEAEEAIFFCLKRLKVPNNELEHYFRCQLAKLPGWAGYIKWRHEWQDAAAGIKNPINLVDFLAVRLVIACALGEAYTKEDSASKKIDKRFFHKVEQSEKVYLNSVLKEVVGKGVKLGPAEKPVSRPLAQVVFCIDVRSEPFRRRLELEGDYETFGFAGFFGLPVSVRSYNTGQVDTCCPVLLKPRYEVCEKPIAAASKQIVHHKRGRKVLDTLRIFYQDLKYNFATPFALVETLGVWYGIWMAIRTLMPVRSVQLKQAFKEKVSPTLQTVPEIDMPLSDQILYAESALRIIGLTKNFAPLVVFCGHGSATENNPYASALDCGACGGNHGGPNAKILAAIFNSLEVRQGLLQQGIAIPSDTLFVAAEHTTTTDDVVVLTHVATQGPHKELVDELQNAFVKAGVSNSCYRCEKFGIQASALSAKKHVISRSTDWAEVRPEWGLVRNAAFIIGPRSLTKDVDLDGRSFLHSYEWQEDDSGKWLETILTAPMVVAEWISTQYFFSTLNNVAYGSGSKITHNITGKFGVMQGNCSDLMQGLALQSVYKADDERYHELMRLQVIVYAPRSRIDLIVEKQSILQTLFFNNWVILVAIDPNDNKPYRLLAKGEWEEISIDDQLDSSSKADLLTLAELEEKLDKYLQGGRELIRS